MEVPASLKALLPSGPDRQESLPGIIDTNKNKNGLCSDTYHIQYSHNRPVGNAERNGNL